MFPGSVSISHDPRFASPRESYACTIQNKVVLVGFETWEAPAGRKGNPAAGSILQDNTYTMLRDAFKEHNVLLKKRIIVAGLNGRRWLLSRTG